MSAGALCRDCGFCCGGTLFANVVVEPDDDLTHPPRAEGKPPTFV